MPDFVPDCLWASERGLAALGGGVSGWPPLQPTHPARNLGKMPLDLLKSDVAEGATNTPRPLTHSLERSKEGLTVDATHEPEEWRPVVGWEGWYEVSNLGKVRSLHPGRFRFGTILHGSQRDGYKTVRLCKPGRSTARKVHQLVLEAFVGPRPPGHITRHLNSVRHDNRLSNLAWGTHVENSEDLRRTGYKPGPKAELWNR